MRSPVLNSLLVGASLAGLAAPGRSQTSPVATATPPGGDGSAAGPAGPTGSTTGPTSATIATSTAN